MIRRLIVLLTLVSLGMGAVVSAQASTCDTTIDNGLHGSRSMVAKDYATAYDLYRCALALYPLDAQLHLGRAESAVLSGRYTDSWASYTVLVYYYQDALQARVDELNTLVTQSPKDADLLLLQATTDLRMGYYDEAAQAVDSALAIEPDNVYANLLKAESLADSSDLAGFRTYATQARRLSDDPYTRAFLANDYDQYLGETDTAIDLIGRAVVDQPENAEFHALLAYFLNSRQDNLQAGAAEYRTAVGLNTDNTNVLISAASTLTSAGDTETANAAMDRLATLLPPGSRDLYVTRAYVAEAAKKPLAAAEEIDAYAKVSPDKITAGGPLESGVTSTESMSYDRLIGYTLDLQANDTVTLQADSLDGSVDAMLAVIDPTGHGAAFNDDYDATENYNAQVTFTAGETGTYTVWVTHAGAGSYGDVTTTATVESAAPIEATEEPAATAAPDLTVTAEAAI